MTTAKSERPFVLGGTNRGRLEPEVPVVAIVEQSAPVAGQIISSALTDEATSMHGTTRCSCAACRAERDTIRTTGLGQMRVQRTDDENDYWADVSWDDPVNRFPGADGGDGSHNEGGRQ